jgi:hypothetical protein
VVRVLLHPGLIEEEQVAGARARRVAADEACVELLERARVCELREGSVREVRLVERACRRAEEFFADGAALQRVGANVRRDGVVRLAHAQEPRAVVRAQGLAPGEAHEARAVALINVPLLARLVELLLGDGCEPLAEALAVAERAQLFAVGDAVRIRVVPARLDRRDRVGRCGWRDRVGGFGGPDACVGVVGARVGVGACGRLLAGCEEGERDEAGETES